VSWCQKITSFGLYGAREITEADTPTIRLGATPFGLHPRIFKPDALPATTLQAPTLSWLGTGIKYAGLHTQWRG